MSVILFSLSPVLARFLFLVLNFSSRFFVASCCVLVAGALGVMNFVLLALLEPFVFGDQLYLLTFGAMMFILDAPLNFRYVLDFLKI